MRKMTAPLHDAIVTFDTCVSAIGNLPLRAAYQVCRPDILQANASFDLATQNANWASLPRVPRGNPNVLVAGTLTKGQLVSLYTAHMVGTTGASRDIYDAIFSAAGGLCPFCGGLGQVRTLDHYLPKANFPAFSVHPKNLIPCCRDCNDGKNSSFGIGADEQALHPYLDQDHFFDERWLVARAERSNPVLIRFECIPPNHWSDLDKARVNSHFENYKIALRFSVQAGAEVSKVVQLRANSLRRLTPEDFRSYLNDNAISPDFDLNGWSRTMYASLAASDWFVQTDFHNPDWHLVAAA